MLLPGAGMFKDALAAGYKLPTILKVGLQEKQQQDLKKEMMLVGIKKICLKNISRFKMMSLELIIRRLLNVKEPGNT